MVAYGRELGKWPGERDDSEGRSLALADGRSLAHPDGRVALKRSLYV